MTPTSIGPYRIVRQLGEGGMGVVYEARQESLDRRVALKTLHPEYARNQETVTRFFNEAKVLSRLEHPSIVQVSDFGTTPDGTAYLVMEYLRGESLGHRLGALADRGERLPVVTTLQIAWQVADVLAVAHAMGVVHRDLKPDNLMLVADPVAPSGERVKLLDFGIAKLTNDRDRSGLKTDTQAVMGTPMYMSPEQCAGAGGVDARSDVYSLGCVLYEALGGRPPFIADGGGRIIAMHLFQEPAPLLSLSPKTPASVAELVHRLLTKDKRLRPNMSDAADSLGRLLSKLSGAGPVVRSRLPSSTDPDSTQILRSAPPSTTLGNSIGQHQNTTRRRRIFFITGSALALLVAVVITLRVGTPPPTKPIVVTPVNSLPVTPSPPPVPLVKWTISSEPSGAAVFNEQGTMLGNTPWKAELTPKAGTRQLRLRREGYADSIIDLDESSDSQLTVRMVRLSAGKPALTKLRPTPGNPQPAHPKTDKRPELSYED